MIDKVDLLVDYPSKIAEKLKRNEIDVGLVPVSIIPEMKEYYIISDYCIGCKGEVGSVCLFSDVGLNKIEKILLDYQSKTSVDLLKILLKEYWKIKPELISTTKDYRNKIKGTTAGLIIGDRALEQRNISPYKYDLGLAWKELTGLPFVFAAWVSNKKLEPTFIKSFNKANELGLKQIDKVVNGNSSFHFDLKRYFTEYISYKLTDKKKEALHLFLQILRGK